MSEDGDFWVLAAFALGVAAGAYAAIQLAKASPILLIRREIVVRKEENGPARDPRSSEANANA